MPAVRHDGAQVNRLVLVNNSKRPLLLLAGEIVTGGKQDRVIGKDRIVPPESDPVDLSVFCVEPGRWVATSEHFGASEAMYGSSSGNPKSHPPVPMAMMAQPSVRAKAMGDKNQAEVWDEVRKQQSAIGGAIASFGTRRGDRGGSYQFLCQGDGKRGGQEAGGRGRQADRAELSKPDPATA